MVENEAFLERWSRRKTDANERDTQTPKLESEPEPEGGEVAAREEGAEAGKAPAIDPKDLPDIDSLDAQSDFSISMREGVPDQIRTLAMRKLWRPDQVLGLREVEELRHRANRQRF